ncbi:MAG: hypothetical protein LLG13_04995 [Bacteroidales bacterium]|nr:hypothetical protein [Bacteroidales bacterium]
MKNGLKFIVVCILFFSFAAQNIFSQSDDVLFRKYLVSSGWNGLLYGGAIDVIGEVDGAAAAGIPIITAGVSVLLPLITNASRTITPNQLMLSSHGKTLGWVHGFAISTLILGEDAWNDDNGNGYYKLTTGLGALSSIGLGMLGSSLGKNKNWSEGRTAMYRHYGWLMPFTGFSIAAAFSDDARVFGGSILLFGAGGYLIADAVNNIHEYTRGEVRATRVLTVLNGGLGYGILSDIQSGDEFNRTDWLIPAAGVLSGTLAGHLWLKNTNLTSQQGLMTAYASTGGAILGLGVAMLIDSEELTPWYLIPYATAMSAYAFTVEHFKKVNLNMGYLPGKDDKKSNWDIAIMPQNLFINSKIQNTNYPVGCRFSKIQPVVAATVTF